MALTIEIVPGAGCLVLAVRGDVDIATSTELRQRLADAVGEHRNIVVDLDAVGFMDSTGLGVLVASFNRAKSDGHRLVIARPQRIVRNALRLVQVDSVIDVYESLDDAVASLAGAGARTEK